ncbi:MAG: polymer-forming cytoskeletal protein [Alphaproteobacteria bacterium]|nr:polymer-forming cytoskeletal protein [Alphaproteobacteria bacterium]
MGTVKEITKPDQLRPATSARPGAGLQRKTGPLSIQGDSKRLTVGREISLSGEISSCEMLVVEGAVKATLDGCRTLEITRSGKFDGTAHVAVADIAGLFDGTLMVSDRLILRATGRIVGTVRYGEMEIERGGRLEGTAELMSGRDPSDDSGTEKHPLQR